MVQQIAFFFILVDFFFFNQTYLKQRIQAVARSLNSVDWENEAIPDFDGKSF